MAYAQGYLCMLRNDRAALRYVPMENQVAITVWIVILLAARSTSTYYAGLECPSWYGKGCSYSCH